MLTFLIPIAICMLTLLILRLAHAGACRDYIEQRQPSAGIAVPVGACSFGLAMPAAPPRGA
jgi:hypothetical protein